jgi:hypothetical protein
MKAYKNFALAVAAFERSEEVSPLMIPNSIMS